MRRRSLGQHRPQLPIQSRLVVGRASVRIDRADAARLIGPMRRVIAGLLCVSSPTWAMVGGALPAGEAGRPVILLVGSRGTSCTGVALARDLVLTAGHCVLSGADYKLVEFSPTRQPTLKDLATIERHPNFDVSAVLRHRVTADVALLRPATPLGNSAASLAPS